MYGHVWKKREKAFETPITIMLVFRFFELFGKYDGYKDGHAKLKKPKQLQEILDIARGLLVQIEQNKGAEIEEKKGKLEQLKSVLEM